MAQRDFAPCRRRASPRILQRYDFATAFPYLLIEILPCIKIGTACKSDNLIWTHPCISVCKLIGLYPKDKYHQSTNPTNLFSPTCLYKYCLILRSVPIAVPVNCWTLRKDIPFLNKDNSLAYCSLYSCSDFLYEEGRPSFRDLSSFRLWRYAE